MPKKLPDKNEFVLNTGRVRDQWHTMTRTGKAPRLLSHVSQPYVQINGSDAKLLKIADGDTVNVRNANAEYLGVARISYDQRPREIFAPMHWSNVYSSRGRVGALVNPITDPLSGQPEFKQTPVTLTPYLACWYAALISIDEVTPDVDYWSKVTAEKGFVYQLADEKPTADWQSWLASHYKNIDDWALLADGDGTFFRAAGFIENTLAVVLLVSSVSEGVPATHWLSEQLGQTFKGSTRFSLLAATSTDGVIDQGAIICSCFQVGELAIKDAISQGCDTPEKLGEKLQCGTNCGSCVPELASLIGFANKD